MSALNKRKISDKKELYLADKRAPFNYVEAYKMLRTNLDFIASSEEYKTIVVTSTAPYERKSNVCINLAYMFAAAGSKVCIVDCDLRKPVHHKLLRLGKRVDGLTSVLSGKTELQNSLYWVKDLGIYSLPSGPIPPNPSELISTPRMKAVLQALEQTFDYIIIDSPPASVVTDAVILGHMADGVLFVARQNYVDKKQIKATKEKLERNNVRILGAVMTGFDVSKAKKGDYYYYSYNYTYGEQEE